MPSSKQLKILSRMNISAVDRSQLVDINNVRIDTTLPGQKRMEKYLNEIKNPYCFLCGDTPVMLSFNPKGNDLNQTLKNYFINLKNR